MTNKTILLVEDDIIIAMVEKEQLSNLGYQVSHVHNGEEAISFMKERLDEVDLVLMDIDLGQGIDGTIAAKEILKIVDVPLLFLSNHTEPEIVQKTEKITNYGYVVKNTGITVLDASIKMAFKLFKAKLNEKIKEKELLISESELKATIYSIGDAFILTDIDGKIQRMNEKAEFLTGRSEDESQGKKIEEIFYVYNENSEQLLEAKNILQYDQILFTSLKMKSKNQKAYFIDLNLSKIENSDDNTIGTVIIFRDKTKDYFNQKFIRTRLELFEYAENHSLDDLIVKALDDVGDMVESPIGFYHFVESDQQTLSLQQWSTKTLQEFCKAEGKGLHYNINQAGVWVDCVREKKPIIHNDYESLPHKKGLPEGHAKIIRELVVPVIRDGKIVAILGVGNKFTNYTEDDLEIVKYFADVTWVIVQQKKNEEQIKNHLLEKDLLLKEIHHRIRNNISTMENILYLQIQASTDNKIKNILTETKSRISALRLLYEKLMFSESYREVSVKLFLSELIETISNVFEINKKISITKTINEYSMNAKKLISIGTIVNELLTNAFKHGFEGIDKGEIKITFEEREFDIILIIQDDGIGFPDGFSVKTEAESGFGYKLIYNLCNQLKGTITAKNQNGAKVTIILPK